MAVDYAVARFLTKFPGRVAQESDHALRRLTMARAAMSVWYGNRTAVLHHWDPVHESELQRVVAVVIGVLLRGDPRGGGGGQAPNDGDERTVAVQANLCRYTESHVCICRCVSPDQLPSLGLSVGPVQRSVPPTSWIGPTDNVWRTCVNGAWLT